MSKRQPTDDVTDGVQKATNIDTAKQVMKDFSKDDVPGLAAEIAYHLVFALAPLLIFIISVAAIVDNYTGIDVSGQLQDLITEQAPEEAQDVLNTVVDNAVGEAGGGFASIGAITSLLIALWSGSNAIATLMKAFNRAYAVTEARSFVKKKLVAIGLTILMGVLINLAFVLFVFGGDIGEWVADWFGLGTTFNWAWDIARFPLAIIFIMSLLAVLYYFGPNIDQTFRWISPGSVIATILWIAVVFGFQIYLTFASPGSAYGAFAGMIVLLFFFYVTGIVFLIGAEVNSVIGRQFDPATIGDLMQGRAEGELASDSARRTAQLAPQGRRNRAMRLRAVNESGQAGSGAPAERSLATRVVALGAVSTAVGVMFVNKIKSKIGK
jgi:membrane protein